MTLKIWNRLLFQIGLVHALIVYRTMTAVLSLSFVEPNKPDRPERSGGPASHHALGMAAEAFHFLRCSFSRCFMQCGA